MSLTNMLLADASVSKGGPGSGPQGGKGKDTNSGRTKTGDKIRRERQGKINRMRGKYPMMSHERAAKLVDEKNPHYSAHNF